jgi:hypothetical protein
VFLGRVAFSAAAAEYNRGDGYDKSPVLWQS